MTMAVSETAPLEIVAWRMDRLIEAGYPVLTAMRLAEDLSVDLHRACELLEQGATLAQALRILL